MKKIILIVISLILVASATSFLIIKINSKVETSQSKISLKDKKNTISSKKMKSNNTNDKKSSDTKETKNGDVETSSKKNNDNKETANTNLKSSNSNVNINTNNYNKTDSGENNSSQSSNNQSSKNTTSSSNPVPVHERSLTEWEKLGISEYDYYNTPSDNEGELAFKGDMSLCQNEINRLVNKYYDSGLDGGNYYTINGKYTHSYLGCGIKMYMNGQAYTYNQIKSMGFN